MNVKRDDSGKEESAVRHWEYFSNRECEYFPCHPDADPDDFNCLFCYCPLYVLGRRCGGHFVYSDSGIKDCTGCVFPHRRENAEKVRKRYREIADLMKKWEERHQHDET